MIVLCGAGHVAYGLGMPTRMKRRCPASSDRIVLLSASGEVKLSPEDRAQARKIEITHEQLRDLHQPIAQLSSMLSLYRRGHLADSTVSLCRWLPLRYASQKTVVAFRIRAWKAASLLSPDRRGMIPYPRQL